MIEQGKSLLVSCTQVMRNFTNNPSLHIKRLKKKIRKVEYDYTKDGKGQYNFFTDKLKIPVNTLINHYKEGTGKEYELFLYLKRVRKFSSIRKWKSLDLSKLNYRISRMTYFKRIKKLIQMGLAYESKNGVLILVALEKTVNTENGKDVFIRVENDYDVIKRIYTEVIRNELRQQEVRIEQQKGKVQELNEVVSVTHLIGCEVKTYMTNPEIIPHYSCKGIAKLFGYSSSSSGWRVLKQCNEYLQVTKRFISLKADWKRPKNASYLEKPAVKFERNWVRPIASAIKVTMLKAKEGIRGLNNPRYRVEWSLMKYPCFNDIIDVN